MEKIITSGMRTNMNDPNRKDPWSVADVKDGGLVIYDSSLTSLQNAKDLAGANSVSATDVNTLSCLISREELEEKVGEETAERIIEVLNQGGFVVINAALKFLLSWNRAPNNERGGH